MKTLYISDLDGTLFTSKKELSPLAIRLLNDYIDSGGSFTVATARTAYGCDTRLAELNIRIPAILMNGVVLYNFSEKHYVDVQAIEPSKVAEIERVLDKHGTSGFMYLYEDDAISLYYKDAEALHHTQYYSERAQQECREIAQTNSFAKMADEQKAIYFALTGEQSVVERIRYDVAKITEVGNAFYLNIYNGLYCLEIFSALASKAAALEKLKQITCAEKVVVFGDNHNDLSMMRIADEAYAPANAIEEVKQQATAVLQSCDDDGVARFIQQHGREPS